MSLSTKLLPNIDYITTIKNTSSNNIKTNSMSYTNNYIDLKRPRSPSLGTDTLSYNEERIHHPQEKKFKLNSNKDIKPIINDSKSVDTTVKLDMQTPNDAPNTNNTYIENKTSSESSTLINDHNFVSSKNSILREVCDKWSHEVESAFISSLKLILKNGTYKIKLLDKNYGRNELISIYIQYRTGEVRTKKQISSHIQVWKKAILNKMTNGVPLSELEQEVLRLIEHGVQQSEPSVKLFYSIFEEIIDPWSKQRDGTSISKGNTNSINNGNHDQNKNSSSYIFARNNSSGNIASQNRNSLPINILTATTTSNHMGKLPCLSAPVYHVNPGHQQDPSYTTTSAIPNLQNRNSSVISSNEESSNENRRSTIVNSTHQSSNTIDVNNTNSGSNGIAYYQNGYYTNASNSKNTPSSVSSFNNILPTSSNVNPNNQFKQLTLPPVTSIPSFRTSFSDHASAPMMLLRQSSSQAHSNNITPTQTPPQAKTIQSLPPPSNVMYTKDGQYQRVYNQENSNLQSIQYPQQYSNVTSSQYQYPVRSQSYHQAYPEENSHPPLPQHPHQLQKLQHVVNQQFHQQSPQQKQVDYPTHHK